MTKSAFELLCTVQYHMLTHSRTEASYFSYLLEVIEKKKQNTEFWLKIKGYCENFYDNYLMLDSVPSLSLWHDFVINILGHR